MRNFSFSSFWAGCLLFLLPLGLSAQTICSDASAAEKIYLQLDRKVYPTDGKIWFKCIVASALSHQRTELSRLAHVELISPLGKRIETKIIPLKDGIGSGVFSLSKKYKEGVYLVQAYTEWNKNFGNDFLFKEYVQLVSPKENPERKLIQNLSVRRQTDGMYLSGWLSPDSLDHFHRLANKLKVRLAFGEMKDSLFLKKKKGMYRLDYRLPDSADIAQVSFVTQGRKKYSVPVIVNPEAVDLQFFPESGKMVHGFPSKIGFKAVDVNGNGIQTGGEIVNAKGESLGFFMGNALGMGSFVLPRAEAGEKYFASLRLGESGEERVYPLPSVAESGFSLEVKKLGTNLRVQVNSAGSGQKLSLRVSCRGRAYARQDVSVSGGTADFSFPADGFPEGVLAFTLLDRSQQIVAERLFFNVRKDFRLNINMRTDRPEYSQRDSLYLQIKTNEPRASLSVLVLDKKELGGQQRLRENILSYFLFHSDLKGSIENPGFYYRKGKVLEKPLDDLMLTQGWRRYKYRETKTVFSIAPEKRLTVSGTVKDQVLRKAVKNAKLTLMTFANESQTLYTTETDSLGRFRFQLMEEYGGEVKAVIQSANKRDRKRNYFITLDRPELPEIHYAYRQRIKTAAYVKQQKALREKRWKEPEWRTMDFGDGVMKLDSVAVEADRITEAARRFRARHGKPSTVIAHETLEELEEDWHYGLFSILESHFSDKVRIRHIDTGDPYAKVIGKERTFILVDGKLIEDYEYLSIPYLKSKDIASIDIYEQPDSVMSLVNRFPENSVGGIASELVRKSVGRVENKWMWTSIGLISIYTKSGKGLYVTGKARGMKEIVFSGCEPRVEFYSPKYRRLKEEDWKKPDLRSVLFWEPELAADSSGRADCSFYNPDNAGEMLIVVEGISKNGKIGYQEAEYTVRKRKRRVGI
ncbi:MAG: carboxypeptidase-like regulatory domain-containing protein [Cytophagales bacterium]|nr:carboxypeptidase-like regulatory domain-containing protein [Cytophagales bacterium]